MGLPKTQFEVDEHNRRVAAGRSGAAALKMQTANAAPDDVPAGGEKKLHQQIEAWLKQNRILYRHDRMDMPTTGLLGWPDFTIFPADAKAYFIECKTATGKLSSDQRAFELLAKISGYRYEVVRSFRRFLEVTKL